MRTDRHTGVKKQIIAFRNFAPKQHTSVFRECGCLDYINYHQHAIWINGVIICAKYKTHVAIKLGILLSVKWKTDSAALNKKQNANQFLFSVTT
jgi:hypothetical protein